MVLQEQPAPQCHQDCWIGHFASMDTNSHPSPPIPGWQELTGSFFWGCLRPSFNFTPHITSSMVFPWNLLTQFEWQPTQLLYASSSWWGATSASDRTQLQSTFNRAAGEACASGVLYPFPISVGRLIMCLPPPKVNSHNLRKSAYFVLCPCGTNLLI